MYNLANNAWSRLASSVGANDTTITVASAILFPEPPFVVSIADEILEVTSVSGNTFTVVRGVEGTSSSSYLQGERVDARFTAGVYGGLKDTILNHLEDTDNPHNLLADLISFIPTNPSDEWNPSTVAEALDNLAEKPDKGENQYGYYWRWENGLQICYKEGPDVGDVEAILQDGGFYRSRIGDYLDLSFPANFVLTPYQNCYIDVRNGVTAVPMASIYRGYGENKSLDSWLSFLISSYGNHNYYRAVRLLAIGRWK